MNDRKPAEVFAPGEFILEEIEARGWTQTELAEIIGRSYETVNLIVNAKRGISPQTAKDLSEAFGTSAQFWLNLDAAYRPSQTDENHG